MSHIRHFLGSSLKWLRRARTIEHDSLIVRDLGCYVAVDHSGHQIEGDRATGSLECPCGGKSRMYGCGTEHRSPESCTIGAYSCFPIEIWYRIVEHASHPVGGTPQESQLAPSGGKLGPLKGLANASKSLRAIVLQCWARDLKLLHHEDVDYLKELGEANSVDLFQCTRRIVCTDSYRVYQAPSNAFDSFKSLQELVLDGHSDVTFGRPGNSSRSSASASLINEHGSPAEAVLADDHDDPGHARPSRMSYRKLRAKFPPTLRILRIYNSHVPDIYYIHKVVRECPELRSLTLARCTMFTRANCEFWERLPRSESDSYFNNLGVEGYATAVGKELSKIPKLQEVQIGIYLTDHEAIDAHLEQHAASTRDTLGVWAKPCNECALEYQEMTESCEQAAALVLARIAPSLSRVSWLSFFSEGRTGWHTCQIEPRQD
ncbi:hypothetical protein FRC08_003508 [Ceratobasidium sp. 394]|nr:hypothetical protein FRC08_003508 [Ceratobasidium sp. 394]KAG9101399.1 hypothetical protein FS749_007487 [Ceratobasidium sp. UAMH 11750]